MRSVTTEEPSSSRTLPLPRPLPGSSRPLLVPSYVLPDVTVAARPPTTQDKPRCSYSKGACSFLFEAVLFSDMRKGRDPKIPTLSASQQTAHQRLVSMRRDQSKRHQAADSDSGISWPERPGSILHFSRSAWAFL